MTTPIGPGTRVTPSVRLLRPLGAGGMGSVWAASHDGLGAEVAVKLIRPEQLSHSRSAERFAREASLAARIRSPHVVKVFDHGTTDDGTPYIVMELLRGESLADRIERERRLAPRLVAMLVTQAAAALEAAHALGVVHRDVKPGNIFLEESGYELFVKILDFGIAKDTDRLGAESLTETGGIIGTPFYMSPEQLLSPKEIDSRADLWGLAVVAYHALTGRLPFTGATVAALAVAMREGAPPPPSSLVRSLPDELDVWFRIALHRDLRLRFVDAAALADSFDRAVRGLPSMPTEGAATPDHVRAPLPRRSDQGADAPPPTPPTVHSPVPAEGAAEPTDPRVGASERANAAARESERTDPDAAASTRSCEMGVAVPASAPAVADTTLRVESGQEGASDPLDRGARSSSHGGARPRRSAARATLLLGGGAVLLAAGYLGSRGLWAPPPEEAPVDLAPPSRSEGLELPSERRDAASPPEPGAGAAASSEPESPPRSPASADRAKGASSVAPASAHAAGPRPRSSSPELPVAPTAVGTVSSAPDCTHPFVVDEHGDLHPRRECLH